MLLKIKKQEVANYLIEQQGFNFVATDVDDVWYIEPPSTISNTKARKLVSAVIKLNLAMMDLMKAKTRYNKLAEEINKIVLE
jgi:uncharacterized protein with NRDE domain